MNYGSCGEPNDWGGVCCGETREKTFTEKVIEQNKRGAIEAAKVKGGEVILNNLTQMIKGLLPESIQPYVDTVYGKIIIANGVSFLVKNYSGKIDKFDVLPNQEILNTLADALVIGSYYELIQEFEPEELLSGLLENVNLKSLVGDKEDMFDEVD